jgi:hypothetical protein
LLAYPRAFRETYGREMAMVFHEQARDAVEVGGAAGLVRLWPIAVSDLILSASKERAATMRPSRIGGPALVAPALGFVIGIVDTSPGWDDTGVSAAVLFACCATLGALRPARPWRWALAVGMWIPALNIARLHNYASLIALVFAFGGAYAGSVARRAARTDHAT